MSTIEYIKQVRDQLGIGLAEAKELIERFETPEKAVEAFYAYEEQQRLEEEAREFEEPEQWKNDWYWKIRPVEEGDLEMMKMLTKNSCQRLWAEFVTEHSDHLMRPDAESCWKISNNRFVTESGPGYNWESDQLENKLFGLEAFIQPFVDWNPDDLVYVFFGRYSGFQLNWKLFLKYANPLLIHAYGVVLVNVNDPKVLIFEEHGYIQVGERKLDGFQKKP